MIFIGVGLLSLFGKDFLWELERFRLGIGGIDAERTELWDLWVNVAGLAFLIMGALVLLVQLWQAAI